MTLLDSLQRYNKIPDDLEDEQAIPLDQILVQPFTATDDPRVLGIEPIPNIAEKISAMIEKYRRKLLILKMWNLRLTANVR